MIRFGLSLFVFGIVATFASKAQVSSTVTNVDSVTVSSMPKPEDLLPEINSLAVPEIWAERYPAELIGLQLGLKKKLGKSLNLIGITENQAYTKKGVLFIGPKTLLDSATLANLLPSTSRLSLIGRAYDFSSTTGVSAWRLHLETTEKPDFQALYRILGIPPLPTSGSTAAYAYDLHSSYSLAYMDIPEIRLSGEKLQVRTVNIPTYLSKGKLKSITVQFEAKHTKIQQGDRRFLNFYLNNNLLRTFQLTLAYGVKEKFDIPPIVLAPGSYLTFELLAADFTGAGSSDFELEINLEETLFAPEYREDFPLLFSSFPKNMEGKPLEIRYDYTLRPSEIKALGDLLDILNQRPQKEYPLYFPKMTRINGPTEVPAEDSHLILLTQKPEQYEEVFKNRKKLEFTSSGLVHKSDEIGLFLKNHPQVPLAWMELFERDRQHVLLIATDPQDGSPLVEAIDGIEDYYVTDMGNILVADPAHYYYFDIRLKELKSQRTQNQESFEAFWLDYRIYVSALLLILIVVLLIYVYQKSQTAKKKIEDART